MKKSLFAILALAAASLCACGGGGGGSSPSPVPIAQPTVAPAAQNRVVLSWAGAEHSRASTSTHSTARGVLDSVSVTEGVAVGATETSCGATCDTIGDNGRSSPTNSAQIIVQEVNAQGSPVPVPSPSVSVPSIATAGSTTTGTNQQAIIPIQSGVQPGNGTITVTVAGSPQTIPLQVLPNLAIAAEIPVPGADPSVRRYADASIGYRFDANGVPQPVTDTSTADVYAVLAANGNPSALVMPYGYANLSTSGTGISEATAAPAGFVSAGTTIPFGQFADTVNTPTWYLAFKTASGHFVYLALTNSRGDGDAPNYPLGVAFYGSYKFF